MRREIDYGLIPDRLGKIAIQGGWPPAPNAISVFHNLFGEMRLEPFPGPNRARSFQTPVRAVRAMRGQRLWHDQTRGVRLSDRSNGDGPVLRHRSSVRIFGKNATSNC